MGSRRECTRILGLEGFRVERITWDGEEQSARIRIAIERRGIHGYECSGCRLRTWRVRDREEPTWDDMPWAEHRVTLVYQQRRLYCRTCGIRTDGRPARVVRGADPCQTSAEPSLASTSVASDDCTPMRLPAW